MVTQLEWYSDSKLKSYTQGQYDASNPDESPGEKHQAAGALAAVYCIRSDKTTRDRVAFYTYDAYGHVTLFADENSIITNYNLSRRRRPRLGHRGIHFHDE